MAISHDEIIEFLADEIQEIALMCEGRVRCVKHLDEDDDDYLYVEDNLERWADRYVRDTVDTSTHLRLELEADRILAAA